jgi:transcriptional regulator with XRE-family HTH domain
MEKCVNCGKVGTLVEGVFPFSMTLGGTAFNVDMLMRRCRSCKERYLKPGALDVVYFEAARHFARSGDIRPETLKIIRKAAGLPAVELAELLDLRPETIWRMENGKTPPDRRTVALLAAIVEDRATGSTGTITLLRDLRDARKRAKTVVLERIATYEEQLRRMPQDSPLRESVAAALAEHKSGRTERAFRRLAEFDAVTRRRRGA